MQRMQEKNDHGLIVWHFGYRTLYKDHEIHSVDSDVEESKRNGQRGRERKAELDIYVTI